MVYIIYITYLLSKPVGLDLFCGDAENYSDDIKLGGKKVNIRI